MSDTHDLVYVAGPYTSGNVAENVGRAMRMAHALLDAGLHPYVPHLCHFMEMIRQRPYQDWLREDLIWLRHCDYLVRLSGKSSGADLEVKEAGKLKIPVYHSVDDACMGALANMIRASIDGMSWKKFPV
jgi:hypothetical protein